VEPSLEQRIAEVFASRTGVAAVYLFGSAARAGSDVDVGVLFDRPVAPLETSCHLT
jgi:predicted nucleotidyltransferase